ncbi:MAG TPA: SAM-dependent methyltransferase [Acidimicrobiales bacterium]|nr:SAM-dependent methyltransferase [Acidimicrobiales bacterium]
MPFAQFLDIALYEPDGGFFATGGGAGRSADFLTSPAVGPLFGAVLARAVDAWWRDLGQPDPFVVVEAGAGDGALARDVLAAGPACAPALRYVLVERSATLRAAQAARMSLEHPAAVLGPPAGEEDAPAPAGLGPLATALDDLPAQPVTGVVLANELLDNLPFLLLERRPEGWAEVRVGWDGGPVEVLVPAPEALAAEAERLAPGAPAGGRVPLQHEARAWLRRAAATVARGRVVAVDYADATPSLAARPWLDWVRTYRSHRRGGHPLDDPGSQDVTCEVATDQLAAARPPAADRSQAEFLAAHGLGDLAAAARAGWEAGAARSDLAALRHKSRLAEAAALADPAGLGAFRVLEWTIP